MRPIRDRSRGFTITGAMPYTVMSAPMTPTTGGVAASQVKAISTVAWKMATTNKLPRELLNNQVSSTLPVSKLKIQPAMRAGPCSRSPLVFQRQPKQAHERLVHALRCTAQSGAVLGPITTTNQREP